MEKQEFNEIAEKIYKIFTRMEWTWANKLKKGKFYEYKPTLKDVKKCMNILLKSGNSKSTVCISTGRITYINYFGRDEFYIHL